MEHYVPGLCFSGTVYKSVMDQCHNRMAAINRLRSERKEQQEKLSEKRKEGNAHQAQLMVYTPSLYLTGNAIVIVI